MQLREYPLVPRSYLGHSVMTHVLYKSIVQTISDYRLTPGVWESAPIIEHAENQKSDF